MLQWIEEQDDTQDERDDHDDVEYVGASNGLKADEKQESSAGKEESSTADKSTTGDGEAKEPQPDFTVTPSKDGQWPAYHQNNMWTGG